MGIAFWFFGAVMWLIAIYQYTRINKSAVTSYCNEAKQVRVILDVDTDIYKVTSWDIRDKVCKLMTEHSGIRSILCVDESSSSQFVENVIMKLKEDSIKLQAITDIIKGEHDE